MEEVEVVDEGVRDSSSVLAEDRECGSVLTEGWLVSTERRGSIAPGFSPMTSPGGVGYDDSRSAALRRFLRVGRSDSLVEDFPTWSIMSETSAPLLSRRRMSAVSPSLADRRELTRASREFDFSVTDCSLRFRPSCLLTVLSYSYLHSSFRRRHRSQLGRPPSHLDDRQGWRERGGKMHTFDFLR